MKRTLVIFGVIFSFTLLFLATIGSTSINGSNTTCCNVQFKVITNGGMPKSNVTITVPGTGGGQCTTNSNGQCTICVSGNKGAVVTATTSCGAARTFQPCSTPVEIIPCER